MKPKKAIAVLTIIIATVAVATVIPYAAAETGGNQLEFTNLYPAITLLPHAPPSAL